MFGETELGGSAGAGWNARYFCQAYEGIEISMIRSRAIWVRLANMDENPQSGCHLVAWDGVFYLQNATMDNLRIRKRLFYNKIRAE